MGLLRGRHWKALHPLWSQLGFLAVISRLFCSWACTEVQGTLGTSVDGEGVVCL